MKSLSVAEAKAHLSEILTTIEDNGETVVITRRGQPVAKLSSIQQPRKPIDFGALDSLRTRQRAAGTASVRLIRRMRDQRY
jgi:prevent-host-death family protein